MPSFTSDTEWHELLHKTPRNTPLFLILSLAEEWFDKMEELGVTQYNTALQQLSQLSILSAGDIAELFVIAFQYWKQGERLSQILTVLELKLIGENLTHKMSSLSKIAHDLGEEQIYGE